VENTELRCRRAWVHAAGLDFLLLVGLLELSLEDAAGLLSVLELLALDPPELAPPLALEYKSPYHPPPFS
jgi:hypothetical protein